MMNPRQFLTRSKLFLAKGPDYITTYARWRAHRMVKSFFEKIISPRWDHEQLLKLFSPQVRSTLPDAIEELGPSLKQHFINRSEPVLYLSPDKVEKSVLRITEALKTSAIAAAEKILKNQFSYRGLTVTFDQEIDWSHQPDSNIDWTWDLNRHYSLVALAKAYTYTHDEKFSRKAVSLINSWLSHNPPQIDNPVWRPFEVSTRLNSWLWSFFLLLKSDIFAQAGMVQMLNGIAVQTCFLLNNLEYHIQNNHLLIEAKTLATMGLCFPEFKPAGMWQKTGLDIVWKEFANQVCTDGVHAERSTQYHMLVGSELWELISILEDNALPIPASVKARYSKMIEFSRAIVKPDRTIPLFGDASRTDEHIRFDVRWARPGMMSTEPPLGEDTFWLVEDSTSGPHPHSVLKSISFPEGGYFIMRDSNSEKTPYLAFDCGPFGHIPVPSHGHADALSFEMFAFGETLITDCGAFRYHAPSHYRNYFRGVRAHNTLMIDRQDQSILVGTRNVNNPAKARVHRWLTTDHFDLVEGSHDGYTRLQNPAIHKRRILFIKPDYWLLFDSVLGTGQHQLDWLFHFMPNSEVHVDKRNGQAQCAVGRAGVIIHPIWFEGIDVSLISGDETEPQGWVSLESGQKQSAPVLIYSCQRIIPFYFGVLLIPCPKDGLSSINAIPLPTQQEAVGFNIQNEFKNDLILLTNDGKSNFLSYGDWQADASFLLIRQLSENYYQLSVVNGTSIYWRRQLIFEAVGNVTENTIFCEISQDKRSIKVLGGPF